LLLHGFRARNVFDPEGVEDDVWDLDYFHVVDSFEDCEEEGDLLDDQVFSFWSDNIHSVADIVGVLDEEENAGAEEFLGCNGKDEGEG